MIAQRRLGPGRIHHCMRLVGQAERALELMVKRAKSRVAFGKPISQQGVVMHDIAESRAEIEQARLLVLKTAQGDDARVEIGMIKVVGAKMVHNVIDRAIQVHGAKGLTDDTPLSLMYRHAREARIYDGPDEVHVQSVARRILKNYQNNGAGWDFGERDASLNSD